MIRFWKWEADGQFPFPSINRNEMKTIYLTLILGLIISRTTAQTVEPYIAIVKTQSDKYKGILYKVDSSNVILNAAGNFVKIETKTIKTIRIRGGKKAYHVIDLIKTGSDPQEYKLNSNGKMVDKWGNEMPTPEQELATTFFSVIGTAIANGLALPIQSINPNQALFRFSGNHANEKIKWQELNYYSIYYQSNPDVLAELRKMREISSQFKP